MDKLLPAKVLRLFPRKSFGTCIQVLEFNMAPISMFSREHGVFNTNNCSDTVLAIINNASLTVYTCCNGHVAIALS